MEYRNLGRTGLKVSTLCLGTMQFGWTVDVADSLHILTAAAEVGINFIDTADVYSNWVEGNPGGVAEGVVGRWLESGVVPREQMVIATKVRGRMGPGPNDEGLSRRWILREVESSLRRLGTDWIDLYQLHWPDESTPIEETLYALDDLVRRGSVRYIGCSNFPAWRLMQALWALDRNHLVRFSSHQPHYNLIHREEFERELEDVCRVYGLGVLPYSPLAGGFLTGKYRTGETASEGRLTGSQRLERLAGEDRNWEVLAALERLAADKGSSPSQIALAWLLTRPTVTSPIIGPRTIEQLEDNLGALEVALDAEDFESLGTVSDWRRA